MAAITLITASCWVAVIELVPKVGLRRAPAEGKMVFRHCQFNPTVSSVMQVARAEFQKSIDRLLRL